MRCVNLNTRDKYAHFKIACRSTPEARKLRPLGASCSRFMLLMAVLTSPGLISELSAHVPFLSILWVVNNIGPTSLTLRRPSLKRWFLSDPLLDRSRPNLFSYLNIFCLVIEEKHTFNPQVAGAWSERQKMFHGGSFLKLADDDMDIQNPEAQNREMSGF